MALLYDITTAKPVHMGYGNPTRNFGCVGSGVSATGIGHLHEGAARRADHVAVRGNLPRRYGDAFDRAGQFWYPKLGNDRAYIELHDTRGKYLNTVYATPYVFELNTETDAFERRNLGEQP